MTSRIAKNAAWLTVGECVGRLLRIILIFYAARSLGVAEWGISSYVLSWAVLITLATDWGLSSIVTRQLVNDYDNRAHYLSTFFFIKLFFIIAGAIIILFIIPLISALPLTKSIIISLVALVFFDSIRAIVSVINRAREAMHLEALIQVVTQGSILAIGLVMLRQMPTAEGLNIAYAAGSGIGTIIALFFARHALSGIMTSFKRPLVRELLKDSLPIAIVGLLGGMMLNTDIIMLGWMRTPEEIGYYSAAQKVIFTLYVLPTLLAWSVFPAMARLAKNTIAFRELFAKAIKNILLVALPLTVGGIITAPQIIALFYGQIYLPATGAFIILLLTIPVTYVMGIASNTLVAYNQQKHFVQYALMGFTLNIVFNLALIPVWGINGAALSTLITETISVFYIWRKMKTIGDFPLTQGLGKGCIATALMGGIALIATTLSLPVIGTIALSITGYAIALYLLKEPAFLELIPHLS